MKILVPIKQVVTLDEEFEFLEDGSGVDPDFVERELNEWDSFSMEAALQIAEASPGEAEVVAVTVGDEEAEEALLSCLAMGADRGVRVWDESLENADPLAVARLLAAVAEREQPQLVLAGVQSSDAVHGATGIALAGFAGMTHVAVARAVELEGSSDSLRVERELEGGLIEVLSVGLPALLTVQTGANEPRYANLRAIKQASSKPLDVLDPAALGLDEDALAAVRGADVAAYSELSQDGRAEMLEGSGSRVAERVAEIIKERVAA